MCHHLLTLELSSLCVLLSGCCTSFVTGFSSVLTTAATAACSKRTSLGVPELFITTVPSIRRPTWKMDVRTTSNKISCDLIQYTTLAYTVWINYIDFWNVILCILGERYWHFKETCCLHLQDRKVTLISYTWSLPHYMVSNLKHNPDSHCRVHVSCSVIELSIAKVWTEHLPHAGHLNHLTWSYLFKYFL